MSTEELSDQVRASTYARFLEIEEEYRDRKVAATGGDVSDQSIEERLRKLIADKLGIPEEQVVPAASFKDDLNADSLEMVDLIISVEEEFKVQISDEDAEKLVTIQDAIDKLNELLGS